MWTAKSPKLFRVGQVSAAKIVVISAYARYRVPQILNVSGGYARCRLPRVLGISGSSGSQRRQILRTPGWARIYRPPKHSEYSRILGGYQHRACFVPLDVPYMLPSTFTVDGINCAVSRTTLRHEIGIYREKVVFFYSTFARNRLKCVAIIVHFIHITQTATRQKERTECHSLPSHVSGTPANTMYATDRK